MNGDYLQFVKAKLSQKYFDEVKSSYDKGLETDENIFNLADFNGDGKVDEEDKNQFEEYINQYSNLFGNSDIDYSAMEELLKSGNSDEPAGENTQNADNAQTNPDEQTGEKPQTDTAKLNELKEQCLQAQNSMNLAKEKYETALKNTKKAKDKQESLEARSVSVRARYEQTKANYDEILRQKMKQNASSDKSNSNNNYDSELSDARRTRDSASQESAQAQIEYGLASANVSFYDSIATSSKSEYNKASEQYNALTLQFSELYEGLSSADKEIFGANPFINEEQ